MPEPVYLLWTYVGALAVFILSATAFDVWRKRLAERRARQNFPPGVRAERARPDGGGGSAVLNIDAAPDDPSTGEPGREFAVAAGDVRPANADVARWSSPPPPTKPAAEADEVAKGPPPAMRSQDVGSKARQARIAEDNEFLPAALEILETPPSPVATGLMIGICAFFVAALSWAIVGKLDIYAVAQGKIQASGRTKVVQSLEPGRIAAILVQSGQEVAEGDVLVELDRTDSAADLMALERDLESTTAESLRRKAVVAAVQSATSSLPSISFPASVGLRVQQREIELFAAELTQYRAAVASNAAQTAEKQATKERLALSIEARRKVLGLSKERVGMREEIKSRGAWKPMPQSYRSKCDRSNCRANSSPSKPRRQRTPTGAATSWSRRSSRLARSATGRNCALPRRGSCSKSR
jgi:hypothetical protein